MQDSPFLVIAFLLCCASGVVAVVAPPVLFQQLVPTASEPIPWKSGSGVAIVIMGTLTLLDGLKGLSAGLIVALAFVCYAALYGCASEWLPSDSITSKIPFMQF